MASSITERLGTLLDTTPPFDRLDEKTRRELRAAMTLEIYEPGQVVLDQGTDLHRGLFVIESGLVRLYDTEEQRLVNMAGEGAIFGWYGMLQGGVLPYEAKAVEPTVCALLSADLFAKVVKKNESFKTFFEEDLKRYVRTMDAEIDASGAFLLFDTNLDGVVYRPAVTVGPDATAQDAAAAMRDQDTDTVVIAQGGQPMGLITEGDLCDQVLAKGKPASTPAMSLVTRPPLVLNDTERLFDAMQVMMHNRIRRVIIMETDREGGQETGILGVVSAEDIAHFRGLDPIATVERIEKAQTIEELGALRNESNRRLYRLYQQGVQSEDLFRVIKEMNDQLKSRLLYLVETQMAAEGITYSGDWVWIVFGAPARGESTLFPRLDNGIVYADPAPGEEEKAAEYFRILADRACDALEQSGFIPADNDIIAREQAFRQPLSQWRAAYRQWTSGQDPAATVAAALCYDQRGIHGDDALVDALRAEISQGLSGDHTLARILMRPGVTNRPPLSFFGRFELEANERGVEGLNLRTRGVEPIVDMARALALDAGYLHSSSTFARLRYVMDHQPDVAAEAQRLLGAYQTLADLHLRFQMQAAETGEQPGDRINPGHAPPLAAKPAQGDVQDHRQDAGAARQALQHLAVTRSCHIEEEERTASAGRSFFVLRFCAAPLG